MNGARFVHDRLELAGWQVLRTSACPVAANVPRPPTPAVLTSRSSRPPWRRSRLSRARARASSAVGSSASAVAGACSTAASCSSSSARRATSTSSIPGSRASRRAAAAPSPLDAPVISATVMEPRRRSRAWPRCYGGRRRAARRVMPAAPDTRRVDPLCAVTGSAPCRPARRARRAAASASPGVGRRASSRQS